MTRHFSQARLERLRIMMMFWVALWSPPTLVMLTMMTVPPFIVRPPMQIVLNVLVVIMMISWLALLGLSFFVERSRQHSEL